MLGRIRTITRPATRRPALQRPATRPQTSPFPVGWSLALLLAALCGADLRGADGDRLGPFPVAARAVNGLQLRLDARGASGCGFRPVAVRLQTVNGVPSPRERKLKIRLRATSDYWRPTLIYERTVTLASNGVACETVIPVRECSNVTTLTAEVFESGRELKELKASVGFSAGDLHTEIWPSVLFIDANAIPRDDREAVRLGAGSANDAATFCDIRAIMQMWPIGGLAYVGQPQELPSVRYHRNQDYPRTRDVLSGLKECQHADLLPFADLPENWRDLSTFDLTFISLDDAKQMQADHRNRWAALCDWIRSGRTLVIYDPLQEEVEATLRAVDAMVPQGLTEWGPVLSFPLDKVDGYDVVRDPNTKRGATSQKSMSKNRRIGFCRLRGAGLGQVLFVRGDPFKMTYRDRAGMLNAISMDHWSWRQRNGISGDRINSVFWSWFIRGVGTPPVNTFLVSMTLFVLIVGPGSYFVLRRMKRLYLLLVIAPTASFCLLAGLVLYASLADGFHVRSRVRSLTWLDVVDSRAAALSYQTYYSAVGGRTLRFPADACVYQVQYQNRGRNLRGQELLVGYDNGVELKDGFLRARTMTSFQVNRMGPTTMTVDVEETAEGVTFRNGLQSTAMLILVRDAAGAFHRGEKVEPGETRLLDAAESSAMLEELTELRAATKMSPPAGFDEVAYQRFSPGQYYYYGNQHDEGFSDPVFDDSLMERTLARLLQQPTATIPEGGFMAVVERSPAAPLGAEGTEVDAGLEIVIGRWK